MVNNLLNEKKTNIARIFIETLIKEGKIRKEKGGFTEFFLNNSKNSLNSAKLLFKASTDEILQENIGMPKFDGFLWVINSSYYSMFYLARAMIENRGIKIDTDDSIHATVLNALIYYFYSTGKLEKKIIEDFEEAEKEFSETTGRKQAKKLIEEYSSERKKRGDFTYEMGLVAMENKAKTSLERAKNFSEKIRRMFF